MIVEDDTPEPTIPIDEGIASIIKEMYKSSQQYTWLDVAEKVLYFIKQRGWRDNG